MIIDPWNEPEWNGSDWFLVSFCLLILSIGIIAYLT